MAKKKTPEVWMPDTSSSEWLSVIYEQPFVLVLHLRSGQKKLTLHIDLKGRQEELEEVCLWIENAIDTDEYAGGNEDNG